MSAWRRLGGFLIGLGVFLLALFVVSDSTGQPEFGLLGGGFVGLLLGIFIVVTNPLPPPPPNPRFRVLKRRAGEPQPKKAPPPKSADGAGSKPASAGGGGKSGAGPVGKPGKK